MLYYKWAVDNPLYIGIKKRADITYLINQFKTWKNQLYNIYKYTKPKRHFLIFWNKYFFLSFYWTLSLKTLNHTINYGLIRLQQFFKKNLKYYLIHKRIYFGSKNIPPYYINRKWERDIWLYLLYINSPPNFKAEIIPPTIFIHVPSV